VGGLPGTHEIVRDHAPLVHPVRTPNLLASIGSELP
jgi:hypothetical protein